MYKRKRPQRGRGFFTRKQRLLKPGNVIRIGCVHIVDQFDPNGHGSLLIVLHLREHILHTAPELPVHRCHHLLLRRRFRRLCPLVHHRRHVFLVQRERGLENVHFLITHCHDIRAVALFVGVLHRVSDFSEHIHIDRTKLFLIFIGHTEPAAEDAYPRVDPLLVQRLCLLRGSQLDLHEPG